MSSGEITPLDVRRSRPLETASSGKSRKKSLRGTIVLGRYRINSELARGGMSTVYLARDTIDGGLYGVKVLHPDFVAEPRIRERILNESRAVQRIDHPAVVKIIAVGEIHDGQICHVMEYIHGFSLRKLLRGGPLKLSRAVPVIAAISEGLAAAHEQHIIHRDLKPENVLVPRDSKSGTLAKVIDFGIARIIDAPSITTTQHIMGTPEYIAPEQAMGEPVDHRADIYALGVMMYEMLSGSLPFAGRDPDTLLRQHINLPPPPLTAHCASGEDLPKGIEQLVMSCLAKAPWNRPENMSAILSVLAGIDDDPDASDSTDIGDVSDVPNVK